MNSIKLKKELTEKEIQIFESEYSKAKRSMLVTYLFLPFLAFGAPFFYLGKKTWGFSFFSVSIVWVVILAIFKINPEDVNWIYGVLMVVMAFTLPSHVSKRNTEIELQILKAIKGNGKVDGMWSVA